MYKQNKTSSHLVTSMALGITLFRCPMSLLHLSGVNVLQNHLMPADKLCGLYSLCRYSFIVCHTSSIGLRPGLEAGVFRQLISLSVYTTDHIDYCVSGRCLAFIYGPRDMQNSRKGNRPASRTST